MGCGHGRLHNALPQLAQSSPGSNQTMFRIPTHRKFPVERYGQLYRREPLPIATPEAHLNLEELVHLQQWMSEELRVHAQNMGFSLLPKHATSNRTTAHRLH